MSGQIRLYLKLTHKVLFDDGIFSYFLNLDLPSPRVNKKEEQEGRKEAKQLHNNFMVAQDPRRDPMGVRPNVTQRSRTTIPV